MRRGALYNDFWDYVDTSNPDGCWNWTRGKIPDGYGMLRSPGGKEILAHRHAYELVNGKIDDGLYVLHACDNRACCNPKHLWLGTQTDNMNDCRAKGRMVRASIRGEAHHSAKRSDFAVRVIRRVYEIKAMRQHEIAALWGLSQAHVSDLIRMKKRKQN